MTFIKIDFASSTKRFAKNVTKKNPYDSFHHLRSLASLIMHMKRMSDGAQRLHKTPYGRREGREFT